MVSVQEVGAKVFNLALLCSFLCSFAFAEEQDSNITSTEQYDISVTASALSKASPDTVEITVLLETTGKTASEAYKNLETASVKFQTALTALNIKLKFSLRDETISGATEKHQPITLQSSVKAQRKLGIIIADTAKAGVIIDSALQAGAAAVVDVKYRYSQEGNAKAEAVAEAAKLAEQKAQNLAANFKVRLGKLLSITLSEEPSGESIRRKMEIGEKSFSYAEQELVVFVSARYAVER